MVGKSPCRLTTSREFPLGIAEFQGCCHTVRAGAQGGIGGDGIAAVAADNIGDFILGGRHQNLADIGFDRAFPDMDDHRQPVNIGQGFAGQAPSRPSGRG